jgi:HSP20 family protein
VSGRLHFRIERSSFVNDTSMKNKFFVCSAQGFGDSHWEPFVDIYRTRKGWILKVDLAGVRLEDIDISRLRNTLTIEGIRRDLLKEDHCNYYSMEISYSRFKRAITLPLDLEDSSIRMDYTDGMLLIRVESEG